MRRASRGWGEIGWRLTVGGWRGAAPRPRGMTPTRRGWAVASRQPPTRQPKNNPISPDSRIVPQGESCHEERADLRRGRAAAWCVCAIERRQARDDADGNGGERRADRRGADDSDHDVEGDVQRLDEEGWRESAYQGAVAARWSGCDARVSRGVRQLLSERGDRVLLLRSTRLVLQRSADRRCVVGVAALRR